VENGSFHIFSDKVVLRIRNRVCDTVEELVKSDLFLEVLSKYVSRLSRQQSRLLRIFKNEEKITSDDLKTLQKILVLLSKIPFEQAKKVISDGEPFFEDMELLSDFVEQLYNYWRSLHRLVVCDSTGDRLDKRPYRTFNETVEKLMHVIRSAQRDIQENITQQHPRVYRQVSAGAEVAVITLPRKIEFPSGPEYDLLNKVLVTRQVLIYPPMIFNTATNTRNGQFIRVDKNPIVGLDIDPNEWLCFPAKVGSLVILVYFSMQYFELGYSLSNLFELADDADLRRKPDAIYLFGVPCADDRAASDAEAIFYDDEINDLLVATVPSRKEYGYFGYLKKMILTLHNIKMMKNKRLPFHGAMFHIVLRNSNPVNVLLIGDSGAGKSETLEALRGIVESQVKDLVIIADDMGSLDILSDGSVVGYGTEIGAFVRLDDLQKGYALGQIDRTIIMNPDKVNARVIIPVTKFMDVVRGYVIDIVLYANNYEKVDANHSAIKAFDNPEAALDVFRAGAVMSKGTTTTTGLTHSYFANIFGPAQYRDLHEEIAERYFKAFFERGIFVGELCTQLGVSGMETDGPKISARVLLDTLIKK
jgi:hypothetical protein